jgi:maleate isomerase
MGAGFIEARGVSVPVMGSFNEPDDNKVGRISPASIRAAALSLGRLFTLPLGA